METPTVVCSDVATATSFDVDEYLMRETLMQHGIELPEDLLGKYNMQDEHLGSPLPRFQPACACPSALSEDTVVHAARMIREMPSYYHVPEMNRTPVLSRTLLAPLPSQYAFDALSESRCVDIDAYTPYAQKIAVTPTLTVIDESMMEMGDGATPANFTPRDCYLGTSTPLREHNNENLAHSLSHYCSEMLQ